MAFKDGPYEAPTAPKQTPIGSVHDTLDMAEELASKVSNLAAHLLGAVPTAIVSDQKTGSAGVLNGMQDRARTVRAKLQDAFDDIERLFQNC